MRKYLAAGFGKDLPKKIDAIYGFDITKTKGKNLYIYILGGPVVASYTVDLKNG